MYVVTLWLEPGGSERKTHHFGGLISPGRGESATQGHAEKKKSQESAEEGRKEWKGGRVGGRVR